MSEANKIAVVTGAGTGVGRAASLALMNIGFTVVLVGRRLDMLEETAKLVLYCKQFGGDVALIPDEWVERLASFANFV